LLDDERAFAWREDPLAATADGVRIHDARLPTVRQRRRRADLRRIKRFCSG
jgi:hypothetical protein